MSEKVFTSCCVGGPLSVHVKDGKITRIQPLAIEENDFQLWKINAKGKEFIPPKKVALSPVALTERTRIYAEDRIKYPMKRVDFDPNRERHPENRGKTGYQRISWDEALDIVAGEMQRIRAKYGPEAITATPSSHHNWGVVGIEQAPLQGFLI